VSNIAYHTANPRQLPRELRAGIDGGIPLPVLAKLERSLGNACRYRFTGMSVFRSVVREIAQHLITLDVTKDEGLEFLRHLVRSHPDHLALGDGMRIGTMSPRERIMAEVEEIVTDAYASATSA
jgi:hypothetical protein